MDKIVLFLRKDSVWSTKHCFDQFYNIYFKQESTCYWKNNGKKVILKNTWEYVTKSRAQHCQTRRSTPAIDYRQHLQRKKNDIEGELEE